jgi:hypothetical protein
MATTTVKGSADTQNIPVATPEYIQRKIIDSHNRVLYLLCDVGLSIR